MKTVTEQLSSHKTVLFKTTNHNIVCIKGHHFRDLVANLKPFLVTLYPQQVWLWIGEI